MIEKKRIVGILCMLMTAGLFFVGLWPFDLSPKNRAYWLPDGEGLYFDGHRDRWKLSVGGIACTSSPLNSSKPTRSEKGSFTIDIRLRPAQDSTDGVPHILSFINASGREVLYLGQWKQSLIVRWFNYDQSRKRRMRAIGVDDALIKEKTQRLTIVSNQEAANIYLDGKLANRFQGTALIGEKESIRGYSVILGNSKDATSSWTGSILALKLYERELGENGTVRDRKPSMDGAPLEGLIASFAFDKTRGKLIPDLSGNENSVTVPERITTTHNILAWPDWDVQKRAALTKDMIVNVLGFVPLGFLFAVWLEQITRWRRWSSYLFAILLGGLISLGMEVTQAYIPARDSSLIDVLCNITGAILGVTGFHLFSLTKLHEALRGRGNLLSEVP